MTERHRHIFNARLNRADKGLEVYCVGKWRSVRYYQGKDEVPSMNIQKEMVKTLTHNIPIESGREVQLRWENSENTFLVDWYKDNKGYKIIAIKEVKK